MLMPRRRGTGPVSTLATERVDAAVVGAEKAELISARACGRRRNIRGRGLPGCARGDRGAGYRGKPGEHVARPAQVRGVLSEPAAGFGKQGHIGNRRWRQAECRRPRDSNRAAASSPPSATSWAVRGPPARTASRNSGLLAYATAIRGGLSPRWRRRCASSGRAQASVTRMLLSTNSSGCR